MSIGVLALVPDNWGGPHMPRHQILMRLSRHFPVVWIDDARPWPEQLRRRARVAQLSEFEQALVEPDNFEIQVPGRLLGEYYRPAGWANWVKRQRIRRAVQALRRRGCRRLVLYIWRPKFRYALRMHDWAMTLYHIDDEYSFLETCAPLSADERALIENSDRVIVHSTGLLKNKGGINPNTSLIPNGVHFDAYAHPADEPADLARLPHPRLGYVGIIKKQLDLRLLAELARERPDLTLVLIGPMAPNHGIEALVAELRALANVRLLGNKAPQELPAYTQHLDIGLLPYRVNAYTDSIYPLKLHEYLAAGIPAISAPIQTSLAFEHCIWIADGTAAWSQAVTGILADNTLMSPAARARRQAVAAEHDWQAITERVAALIRAGAA